MVTGDTQVVVRQRGNSARHGQGRPAQAARVVNHDADAGLSRPADAEGDWITPASERCWPALYAPAATPKEVLETLCKATVQALNSTGRKDAFASRMFNVVPNKSLDDAKTWHAGEIKSWRKITSEVKIEPRSETW